MAHSWSSSQGRILAAPDPVQAYFNATNSFTLDCVSVGSSCSDDCTNIAAIASSTNDAYPLWECALFPNITNAFRLGSLSENQESIVIADGVDTSVAKAATVTSTISSCLSAWCESLDECKQRSPDVCWASSLSINGTMLSLEAVDTCILAICDSHPSPLTNADITGIGQVTSYIIQVGIVLLSGIVLLALSPGRQSSRASYGKLSRPATESHADIDLQNFETLATEHHEVRTNEQSGLHDQASPKPQRPKTFDVLDVYDSLIIALIDFLKAQCFVAIAASIAALVTLNSGVQITVLDATAVGAAAGVSIIPTTFNYYILATFNPRRKSWYLYGLALCTWILGFCVVFSRQVLAENIVNKTAQVIDQAYINSQYPNACGNAAPVGICYIYFPVVHPEFAFYYALCLPVIVGLTIWQLSGTQPVSKLVSTYFYRHGEANSALFAVLHLAAVCSFIAPLAFFFMSLRDLFSFGAIDLEWSFGQIIALTLWIPSVTGFVNSLWLGVGVAHTKQLPERYSTKRITDH